MAESAWLNFHCGTDKQTRLATFHHNGTEWLLAEVSAEPLPEGGAMPGRIAMTGQFGLAPGYTGCPGCAAVNFVRCGSCAELGCWVGASVDFTCGNCGIQGPVVGTIESLDAMDVA
ncbi:hypothetical protein [Actinoplanes palleronii]|uniref:TerY-C metal binding domain-containing protein n=1 Tax=Actinoplanes palleronii TaxID=113570 RepID=A0ABQ4BA56_9ACTN|nr:hypothetical protein [Actinoplanes palleronii]GIE67550.1 hypothetical protein Apa02nite_036580 [Actinoplanes palleronii]